MLIEFTDAIFCLDLFIIASRWNIRLRTIKGRALVVSIIIIVVVYFVNLVYLELVLKRILWRLLGKI